MILPEIEELWEEYDYACEHRDDNEDGDFVDASSEDGYSVHHNEENTILVEKKETMDYYIYVEDARTYEFPKFDDWD
jgi:hypothetical protein